MVNAKELSLVVDWLSSKDVVSPVVSSDNDSVDLVAVRELVREP